MTTPEKVWQELIAIAKREAEEVQRDDEVSVKQFAEQTGMSVERARRFLNHQVQLKVLQRRMPKINGTVTGLYSPTSI